MAEGWTQSQRIAFQWALSAVTSGMTQIAGEEAFRAGGGKIGHELWREVYQTAWRMAGWREEIKTIPKHWVIPERMFESTGKDWAEKFHLSAKVRYFNKETQAWEEKYASANLPDIATRGDWEREIIEAIKRTETSPRIDEKKGYSFSEFLAERW